MNTDKPTFIQVSRAHYAQSALQHQRGVVDEILLRDEGDGPKGEMVLRWYEFSDGKMGVQLGVFDEGWGWLADAPELFEWLKTYIDSKPPTPEDTVEALLRLGFEDKTTEGERPTGIGPRGARAA